MKRENSDLDNVRKVLAHYLPDADSQFSKISWVNGDILDVLSLDNAMQGVDEVYHSAALVSFEPGKRRQLMELNIKGTANMVNAALNKNIKKFAYISSIAALGRPEDMDAVIDENMSWKTSKFNTNYAVSKFAGEREVWRGIAEGLSSIIVNPSIVLGISDPGKGSTRIFRSVWNGLRFYPPGINGFVDVTDVAKATVALMESPIKNERFILNAVNISYLELFTQISRHLGKKPPQIKARPFMMEFAWLAEALKSAITGKKPLVTKETARTSANRFLYSSQKIQDGIGYTFKDFDTTLGELAGYYKNIFQG